MTSHTIEVGSASHPYEVLVQPGLLRDVGSHIMRLAPHETALLVQDHNVVQPHGKIVDTSLGDAGYNVVTTSLAAEEHSKTLASVQRLYECMLHNGLDRGSPVIALGGGIIGDVAGFASATYMRGTPFVNIPTTLLAMVDAAIGGKTGVNLPVTESGDNGPSASALAKNIVGAFWPPRGVFVDPNVLETLDVRHVHAGLAECIKHAMMADASLLSFIEEHIKAIESLEADTLAEFIARSAAIKARIVTEDEREAGPRMLLNLGHTFGHAIEAIREFDVHHGEAVAIGLCAAMHISVKRGLMDKSERERIRRVIEVCQLPTHLPASMATDRLLAAMRVDKKKVGRTLRLVLPTGLGRADVFDDVDEATLRDAWQSVAGG